MLPSMHCCADFGRTCRVIAVIVMSLIVPAPAAPAQGQAPQAPPSTAGESPNSAGAAVELLTSTNAVDFSGYIAKTMATVKKNWLATMPAAFWAGARGKTTVEFRIQSDGKIENILLKASSGTNSLDQAAIQGVRGSNPLDHLPPGFKGTYIVLRLSLSYNQELNAAVHGSTFACSTPASRRAQTPPFDRLELLAFLASGGYPPYATQVICQRGIDFVFNSAFVTTLRYFGVTPDFVDSLTKLKPSVIVLEPPDRVSAYGLLDVALTDKRHGELQKANDDFARAVRLAPDSAALHLAYARNLLADRNDSEAEVQSRRSLELWPDDAEAHLALAMALSLQNRDSEAVPEAREVLRIYPGYKAARAELGISLARSGQYKEAIPVLRDAKFMAPQLPVIYKLLGGSLVHAGGDFDEAIQYLNLFLKTKPDDAEAHYLLGVAWRGVYRPNDALAEFREAARLEPNNSIYSSSLARKDSIEPTPEAAEPEGAQPEDGYFAENLYTNRFFGFSYQFPKGWNVLKAEQGKALLRLSASLLANDDPTGKDVAEAAANDWHPLLFVAKQTTKDISTTANLIQIEAVRTQLAPQLKTGAEFLQATGAFLQRTGKVSSTVNPPEPFAVGNRTFWKTRLDFPVNNVGSHEIEAVTIEKGYFILFIFASPDASKLDELQGTMNSLHFAAPPP
jgi:TonB family protein